MPNFGDYETDVVFDFSYARDLAALFRSAAQKTRDYESSRAAAQLTAEKDFEGHFSEVFARNMQIARNDGAALATALDDAANAVDHLISEATKENARRRQVREYLARHDDWWEKGWDWVFGQEAPPRFASDVLPTPYVSPAASRPRELPLPGVGGSTGQSVSSARPSNLRSASHAIDNASVGLAIRITLQNKLNGFASVCCYGTLDASALVTNFNTWCGLHGEDAKWLRTVADAFAAAGGENNVSTLEDSAIYNALKAANVSASRDDLDVPPAALSGFDPNTGYALDPVNTVTGNFIEPECDIAFTGLAAELNVTRMYNSLSEDCGVLGIGWASTLQQRLLVDDESIVWVQADGGNISFASATASTVRADHANFWLTKDADIRFPLEKSHNATVWVVNDNAGRAWVFTPEGQWLASRDSSSTWLWAERDADTITALVHENGRRVDFTYRDGLLVKALSNDGRSADYSYDDRSRLVNVTTPEHTRRYTWDTNNLLIEVRNSANVAEVINTYDDRRRVISQITPHGRRVRFAYLPGRVTAVSDHDGSRSDTWIADRFGRLIGVVDSAGNRQSMSYDGHGNLVQVTDREGAVTVHVYDQRGRRVRTVLPSRGEFTFAWDEHDRLTDIVTAEGSHISYVYAADQRDPSEIHDALGGVSYLEWEGGILRRVVDPVGVTLSLLYNAHGELEGIENADGAIARLIRDSRGRVIEAITPSGASSEYTYDDSSNLTAYRDAEGATWIFEYDAYGRKTAMTNPVGARTTYAYGDHGALARVIDPLLRTTACAYDDLGNISSLTLPDGAEYLFEYDTLSRLTAMRAPQGAQWSWEYNPSGRVTESRDPSGRISSQGFNPITGEFHYRDSGQTGKILCDPYGRPIGESSVDNSQQLYTRDAAGNIIEIVDAEGGLTLLRRDLAGRLIEHVSPEQVSTVYTYDACGRIESIGDAFGNATTYHYDIDSRVTGFTLPTGERGSYSYDRCGRLLSATLPGNGKFVFSYDACGRLIYQRDSLMGIRRFSYDASGQMVAATNGLGGVTHYDYDERGRVVAVTHPSGGRTQYAYNDLNQCVRVINPVGAQTQYFFDPSGLPTGTQAPDGTRLSFVYEDDSLAGATYVNDHLLSRIEISEDLRTLRICDYTDHNIEHHIELIFDSLNRLIARRDDGVEHTWSYDKDGRVTQHRDINGDITRYEYDKNGQLIVVRHSQLGRIDLQHDASGRLLSIRRDQHADDYRYLEGWLAEHIHRTKVGTTTTQVKRDTWGRVITLSYQEGKVDYGYDDANQLVSLSGMGENSTWEYDEAGRLVTSCDNTVTTRYAYNEAGQLTSIAPMNSEPTLYSYNASGQRVTEKGHNGVKTFSWDPRGWLEDITWDSPTGQQNKTNLWVNALGELSRIDNTPISWDIHRLTSVGTLPVLSLPGVTTVIGGRQPDSQWRQFRHAPATNPWDVTSILTSPHPNLGMTGHGSLIVDGMEWLRHRVYDPRSMGFLSQDPVLAPAGAIWESNPYNYAANNPLNLLDPLGLNPVTDADLQAYASTINTRGALGSAWEWTKNNWEYIAGGAAMVVGFGLMCTGVGGPAGIALMAASGAALSGGSSILMQKYFNGKVDWGQVGIQTLIGGVTGAFGGWAAGLSKAANGARALGTMTSVNAGVGGTSSALTYGLTAENPTPQGYLAAFLSGGLASGISGAAGPAGGTIAQQFGHGATSLFAKGATGVIQFVAGASGSATNNILNGQPVSVESMITAGGLNSAVSIGVSKLVPDQHGTSTLNQASYFGVRTASGLVNPTGPNAGRLISSAITGSIVGSGADVVVQQVTSP
ncbi:DUF6531 domain-containing protein [Schaalia canis]|uniref:Type IV secretion protein Rhs n=1 Tax=Schaalia canis TaxID=100469 RepID=A0A3P1SGZ9_9ACTO|nr:DUF6531 domain-containing protein [Schaalia canis]RRC96025.1 type IV secretion protein Rhs [Schaalia canis]